MTYYPSSERGTTSIHWLESHHSFSFGHFHDPSRMGFRALRVINNDHISPSGGFAEHGHRDMEIITYMISGTLSHKDSTGSVATIDSDEVQRMRAGHGIRHSEFNASSSKSAHLLQIWVTPAKNNLAPGYEQKRFPRAERRNCWRLSPSSSRSIEARSARKLRLYSRISSNQSSWYSGSSFGE